MTRLKISAVITFPQWKPHLEPRLQSFFSYQYWSLKWLEDECDLGMTVLSLYQKPDKSGPLIGKSLLPNIRIYYINLFLLPAIRGFYTGLLGRLSPFLTPAQTLAKH